LVEIENVALQDEEFRLFRELIHRHAGIALTEAKRELVKARLAKRLRLHDLDTYQSYFDLVEREGENGPELRELINCITTNQTDFFRESHHFDFVAKELLPSHIDRVRKGKAPARLRIWHAGCSTGEEPYSMAMTLRDALPAAPSVDVRQLASDIDTNVLAIAQQGVYDEDAVSKLPQNVLRKYFLKGKGDCDGLYRVRQELQSQIVFRQINLLDPAWPIRDDVRFDMIFCRNVVIYFDRQTQSRLFARFAERLKPGGHLFIGHSETLIGICDRFKSLGRTIYQLRNPAEFTEGE